VYCLAKRHGRELALWVCLLLGGWGLAEEHPKALLQSELDVLIQHLGDDDYSTRERAYLALEAQGENARETLTRALDLEDAEIVTSAAHLLYKINRATVVVRAVDSSGKAIVGQPITIAINGIKPDPFANQNGYRNQARKGNIKRELVTDQDGKVSIGDLEPDVSLSIRFECKALDYLPARYIHQAQVLKMGKQEFQMTLLRYGKIEGKFIDEDGKSLAGLNAYLVPNDKLASFGAKAARRAGIQSATTDRQGRFVFERLLSGQYVVALVDGDSVCFKSKVLDLSAEQELALEPLVFTTRNGGFSGTPSLNGE
jgi:hypothetical protein